MNNNNKSTGRRQFAGVRVRVVWADDSVSTVSYSDADYALAFRFAGSPKAFTKAVRDVAKRMTRPTSYTASATVREQVLARLRGQHRPNRDFDSIAHLTEDELLALDAALAIENNAAWECVQ